MRPAPRAAPQSLNVAARLRRLEGADLQAKQLHLEQVMGVLHCQRQQLIQALWQMVATCTTGSLSQQHCRPEEPILPYMARHSFIQIIFTVCRFLQTDFTEEHIGLSPRKATVPSKEHHLNWQQLHQQHPQHAADGSQRQPAECYFLPQQKPGSVPPPPC